MKHQGFTKIADVILDTWMSDLTEAELKTLLVIIRQTTGWNKPRDRISHAQFKQKTGLSQRSVTSSIESLSARNFIVITNAKGTPLTSRERRYRQHIYYAPTDYKEAKYAHVMAKLDTTQRQNLPLTIYNTHRQQYTRNSISQNQKKEVKKQSDSQRIECIQNKKKDIYCSCFRCT